ncbi:glucose-1-phosphate thymidylyltransferase [Pseudothermotoga lettingae]|uniref:Glucose-1-phosphate thymidyltransferase n=1 Tax=Pseudothermotoga lettingae (strain ATCC BAA-301 / DSM 14385 / NBRC 107922 / TMO) TaxID=416591 RepID=A8F3Y9_PSELT|nr:glucose-1-phosphate thymidyltransferase [Pseudothermotoga lettingae TMO]GLI48131.1 glucose-1-phosphate thymidylyltransferase [Pseudothermotoga lettingae TMO]
MKGLVLCAGKGTRLRPLTYTTAKHLIPVANRPVVYYTLDFMKNAGIREIAIVVSPENKMLFEEVLKDGKDLELNIEYIVQDQPKGIAHAVYQARNFIDEDPFLMVLGDNLVFEDIKSVVEEFNTLKSDAVVLLARVSDPRAYGVAVLEGNKVKYVVEKPQNPPSNLAIVGVYMFRPAVFRAIENIKPSWRGELEITDAIGYLIQNGHSVKAHIIKGWWKDTGKPEDLLEANRKILDNIKEECCKGKVDENSVIQGRVSIKQKTIVVGSVIRGPVVIGENCKIINSYVGPYTAIGDNVTLESCEIENSILMDQSVVTNLSGRIDSSILGKGVRVFQNGKIPKAMRLIVGDLGQIQF